MDDEDNEILDNFLSFLHDTGQHARELCKALKKKLQEKKRKWRNKK